MDVRVLAHAETGQNRVALLEQRDYHACSEAFAAPAIYIVTLVVRDRAEKTQTWARTDLDPLVARELYDVACAEFITPEGGL